jgi:hypothetical protein
VGKEVRLGKGGVSVKKGGRKVIDHKNHIITIGWSQVFTSHHPLLPSSVKTPLFLSLQTLILRLLELNRIKQRNATV